MKTILATIAIITCALTAEYVFAVEIAVDYNHASLTQIKIENGRLHYVWHTQRKFERGEPAPMRQDMTNYDRHEATIWLTKGEIAAIAKWIATQKVFDLPASYPAGQEKTYGSALQTTLNVTLEDRKQHISWNGDSTVAEELRAAEKELVQICDGIRKDRDK